MVSGRLKTKRRGALFPLPICKPSLPVESKVIYFISILWFSQRPRLLTFSCVESLPVVHSCKHAGPQSAVQEKFLTKQVCADSCSSMLIPNSLVKNKSTGFGSFLYLRHHISSPKGFQARIEMNVSVGFGLFRSLESQEGLHL